MFSGASDETLPGDAAAPTAAFAPGARVGGGRYAIIRFIAAGAMGEVHEAEDLLLGGRIGIKVLRALAVSAHAVQRLRREISLARKVSHPNVCRVHDMGEHEGRPFITMEMLSGETLADRLARGPLALDELERIARQLIGGLAALHAAGIVHRDFKPGNVVLTESGRAVVTDFGLARLVETESAAGLTVEGTMLGTPSYMAPEQVEGREATAASDIYAVGVVLYEMATGEVPFRGDGPIATATARLHQDPSPPSTLREDVPPRWESAILRCLARDPGARFPRVEDVLPAPAPPRPRRRAVLALVAAAALVVAVIAAVMMSRSARVATVTDPREVARAHLRRNEFAAARAALEPALGTSPDDPRVHYLLSWALGGLNEAEAGAKHARLAYARRSVLGEADQLRLELQHHAFDGNTADALAVASRLVALAPDDVDAALDRASLQAELGRIPDALATLEGLRAGAGARDPRVDLEAADLTSDQAGRRELAARALAAATAQRAPLLEARALRILAWSEANLGDLARAEASAEGARRRFAEAGHRWNVVGALNDLAAVQFSAGKYREANAALMTAVDLTPRDRPSWAIEANAAIGRALVGEVAVADEAVVALPDVPDPMLYVTRGWIAELRGDLPRARAAFDQARRHLEGEPPSSFAAVFLAWRSGAAHARAGDLAAARRDLEAAITNSVPGGLVILGAQARVVLARVALLEGDAQGAEALARQGLEVLTARGSRASVGFAYAVIAEAQLVRGDRDGARATLATAAPLRATIQHPPELEALDAVASRLTRGP